MAPLPDFIPDEAVASAPALPDFIPDEQVSQSAGVLDMFSRGIPFNDEIAAAGRTLGQKTIMPALDALTGANIAPSGTWGELYSQNLSDKRAALSAQAQQYPIASTILPMVTAATLPFSKTAGPIKQGAAYGGLYGFAEGEDGLANRAIGGGIGTAAGGALTAGVGLAGKGIKAALQSEIGIRARERIGDVTDYLKRTILSPELGQAGKVGGGAPVAPLAEALTPEQLQLAYRTREISPDRLMSAAETLGGAIREDAPMTLVEALGAAGPTRQARFLANYEPTMSKVADFVETRQQAAPARIEAALEKTVGGSTSPRQGGEALRKGATEIGEDFRKETNKVAKQVFAEADAAVPEYSSQDVVRVLSHEDVAPSVERARRAVAIDRNMPTSDVPANDAEVVRRTLSDLTKRANDKFDQHNLESGYAQQLKKALENATEAENPALKTARDAYAIMREMRRDAGEDAITLLKNIDEGRLEGAGKVLMSMDEKQLTTLRSTFEKKGKLKEFKAGVRAYFQNVIDSNTGEFSGNTDVVKKMVGDTRLVKRLNAALGEKEAGELLRKLEREQIMYRGMQALNPQSGTAGNLAEGAAFEAQLGPLGKTLRALTSPVKTAQAGIEKLLMRPADEQLAQQMTQTYITDPNKGLADLLSIIPMQTRRYPYIDQSNRLVDALIRGSSRSAAPAVGQMGSRE